MALPEGFSYLTTQLYQSGSTPNPVIAELPFTNVSFTSQLNSIGTFTGDLLLSGLNPNIYNALNGTIPGKTALYVANTLNGNTTIVWSGVIWHRDYDSETQILSISAQEMLSYFQHRRIYKFSSLSAYNATKQALIYTSKEPVALAIDLINGCQAVTNGNIGVGIGTQIYSSAAVTRSYYDFELKSVYQAIYDLSEGFSLFDFNITAQFTPVGFNYYIQNNINLASPTLGTPYFSSGTFNPNAPVFQFPGNIVSYKYPEDATIMANRLFGLGYGANYNKVTAPVKDTHFLGSGWALLDDTVSLTDVVDSTTLNTLTSGRLAALSYPPSTVQVVLPTYGDPQFGMYFVGDECRLDITDEFFPNGNLTYYQNAVSRGGTPPSVPYYKITAIDVQPGENNTPDRVTVTMTLPLSTTVVNA